MLEGLRAFATEEDVPDGVWRGFFWALEKLGENKNVARDLPSIIELLAGQPDILRAETVAASNWSKALADAQVEEALFFRLWDLVRREVDPDDATDAVQDEIDPLTTAINAPGGILAEALVKRLASQKLDRDAGLPDETRGRLEGLVTAEGGLGMHARVVCMPYLDWLYWVDTEWTKAHLLARMRWAVDAAEAERLWTVWLCFGRPHLGPISALKPQLFETLNRHQALDEEASRQVIDWFAIIALDVPSFFSSQEVNAFFNAIGNEGAAQVLHAFTHRLRSVEDAARAWRASVGPWLETHWPHLEKFRKIGARTAAARLLAQTKEAFPPALKLLEAKGLVGEVEVKATLLLELAAGELEENRYRYASNHPDEVCRWLARILPPHGLEHAQRDLSILVAALEKKMDSEAACLRQLRERLA